MNESNDNPHMCSLCQAKQHLLIQSSCGKTIAVSAYCWHLEAGGVYFPDLEIWHMKKTRSRQEFEQWAISQAHELARDNTLH